MSQVLFLSSYEFPFQITEIFKDENTIHSFSYYLCKCKVKEYIPMNFENLKCNFENKSGFTNTLISCMHVIAGYQSITLGTSNNYVMNLCIFYLFLVNIVKYWTSYMTTSTVSYR